MSTCKASHSDWWLGCQNNSYLVFSFKLLPQWYFIFLFYKLGSKFIGAQISLGRFIFSDPLKEDSFKSWFNRKSLIEDYEHAPPALG